MYARGAPFARVRLLGVAVDLEVEPAEVRGRIEVLRHVHSRLALVRDRALDLVAHAELADAQWAGVARGGAAVPGALDRRLVVGEVGARGGALGARRGVGDRGRPARSRV